MGWIRNAFYKTAPSSAPDPAPVDPLDDSKWPEDSSGKRLLEHNRTIDYNSQNYDPRTGRYNHG